MGRALRQTGLATGFAAVYAVIAWLSVRFGGALHGVPSLWAPDVILFAVMLRNSGLRKPAAWVGIVFGSLVSNLYLGASPGESLVYGLLAPAYVAALLYVAERASGKETSAFDQLAWVVASIMGVTFAFYVGFWAVANTLFQWNSLTETVRFVFANLVAAVLFLPFVINVTTKQLARLADVREAGLLIFWTVACAAIMVFAQAYIELPFAFSLLPMMVAAVSLSPLAMTIVCGAAGLAGMVVSENSITAIYQFAICVNVMMPYFVCVLVGQISSARRRLGESEERFRRAVDDAPAAIATVALDGRILACNPAFAAMLGYARVEIEGSFIQDHTVPEDRSDSDDRRRRANAGEFDAVTFQKRQIRRDGTPFWVEVAASFVRDGRTGQAVMISQIRDIDAHKHAERELAEMKDRWDFALASAGQAFWDHNVEADSIQHSTSWTSMFGYDPGEIQGNDELWQAMIHPDDRERVAAMDADHQAGRIDFFQLEYRMRHKHGHWVWILDRGKVVDRDKNGSVKRMIGTLTDISQRKGIEEHLAVTARMLAQEKERLRVTLESIGDAVICTDSDGEVSFMNPEAERLTGVNAQAGVGRPLGEIYSVRVNAADAKSVTGAETILQRPDGATLAVRQVTTPILSASGSSDGSVIVFQDFTEMRRMQRQLEYAAQHDGLTGLRNRAGFRDALDGLWQRSRNDGSEHQVIFIDLDRFKHVNDTAGHAAGDALLKLVAKAIRETVRASDVVARLGGDEFAIVLASCPQSYARLASRAIVERIAAVELFWMGDSFSVGASVGFATLDAASKSIDEAIAEADAACYAAKAAGGGTVSEQQRLELPRTGSVAGTKH